MKLRHVLLLACAAGACGALLLAWDMHKRLKSAESALLLKGVENAPKPHVEESKAPADAVALPPDQATLGLLTIHTIGLLSLAFLFLALFLLLVSALRERAFATAIDGELAGGPAATPSLSPPPEKKIDTLAVVMTLSEAAQKEGPPALEQRSEGASQLPLEPQDAGLPPPTALTESKEPQPQEAE